MAFAVAVAVAAVGFAACDDGGGDDDGDDGGGVQAFCAAVESLEENDPFAELDIASPEEMRTAFDELSDGVSRIAQAAPDEARRQARAYEESVEEVVDQLRGAGFDPRNVDSLDYQQAVTEYDEAAASVENAAGSLC